MKAPSVDENKNIRNFVIALLVIFGMIAIGKLWHLFRDKMIQDGAVITARITSHSDYDPSGGYWVNYEYQIGNELYESSSAYPEPLPCFRERFKCNGKNIKIRVSNRFPSLSKPIDK